MPFIGLGALHFLVALFFAVHAIRSRQETYWLFILFSFPMLGSVAYFFAIYMRQSGVQRGARKVASVALKVLDPERELRAARSVFEATPTAQNQIRLAQALLEAGEAVDAAKAYQACLSGPFANDANIRLWAAKAFIECDRPIDALKHLESVRQEQPSFRKPDVSLALARAYSSAQRNDEARAEFEHAYDAIGGFEVLTYYALWALAIGERGKADALHAEIELIMKHWPAHSRKLNAPLIRRLNAGFAQAGNA